MSVVCNGGPDGTAERSRAVAEVRVIDIEEASKVARLRVVDAAARPWPRISLGPDAQLLSLPARALVDTLGRTSWPVVGIPGRMRLDQAPPVVRLFLEFWSRLPVMSRGIIGGCVYAVTQSGRGRFEAWPDVRGDAQFVLRLLAPAEQASVEGLSMEISPPASVRELVRRGVRVRGNTNLSRILAGLRPMTPPQAGFRQAISDAVRTPRGWLALLVSVLSASIRFYARLGLRDDKSQPPSSMPDTDSSSRGRRALPPRSASSPGSPRTILGRRDRASIGRRR